MRASRCYRGPLIVLPCLMIFEFLQRPAPLLRLLVLLLLASKLLYFNPAVSGRCARNFCITSNIDFFVDIQRLLD